MRPYSPEPLPIKTLDKSELFSSVGEANAELARYDGLLMGMVNPAVMLSPLTNQEAVLSSKIEGTQATIEEVLEHEAGREYDVDKNDDILEVLNYRKALMLAKDSVTDRRLRDRGFNQALEIADVISDCCRIPIDNRCCRRVKHTDAQRNLSAKQRQRNISNAFRVDREIAARKVAIVDDVVTTGATVTELSKTLLRNGVEEVHVWAVARTTAPTAIHAG